MLSRIKSNRWHSPIQSNVPVGYAYRYDARQQMDDARWLSTIPGITNPYYEHIYGKDTNGNEIDGYDANGNIRFLTRNNKLGADITDFEYHYQDNTNKLQSITSPKNQNKTIRNYNYNAIGQMIEQEDAETLKKLITNYDVTGKVTEVRDQDDHLVTTYTYDDRGFRLSKTSYENGTAKLKTWYVRDASGNMVSTYEDTNFSDDIAAIPTEMPVYGSERIGVYKPQYDLTFYELMDHLGNVRAVIGKDITAIYLATMEIERADKETDFIGITPLTISTGMNHTPTTVVIAEDEETTSIPNPNKVIRINNEMDNPTNPIGGGILLPVHPGDKLDAEVFVRYTNFDGGVNNSPLMGMASYLAQSFGAPISVVDGVNIFHGIDESPNGVFSALADADDGLPLAFLTYVVYDRDMVPVLFDQAQAGTAAANGYQALNLSDITIDKEGFIYIYVSNQSPQNMEVFFDDLKVVHHLSDIVGGGDYYPFGLEINDRRITREKHRFGYQGLYAEKDEETGWNHFELREYDPVVARWTSIDPEGQYFSPYVGMGNNPISRTDPNGAYSIFGALWRSVAFGGDFTSTIVDGKRTYGYIDAMGNEQYGRHTNYSSASPSHLSRPGAYGVDVPKRVQSKVEPYISVSAGKESAEGRFLSVNHSVMVTSEGVFATPLGADVTFASGGQSISGASISLSAGVIFGPLDGLSGWGGYTTTGVNHFGLQVSRGLNNNEYYLPNGWNNTVTIGAVISTSRSWVGTGAGYSFKIKPK